MPWNKHESILSTGKTKQDVEREADVIFTAAFIGMTIWQNQTKKKAWRVDMEPNLDGNTTREERTQDDLKSMKNHNEACSKVNYVVKLHNPQLHGVVWGLTPWFNRGGMICAGEGAKTEYAQTDEKYRKTAFAYLTAPQKSVSGSQRSNEMYVGRGAYCGLVLDKEGNAVTAMSTIRTTLTEHTPDIGSRWSPPMDADVWVGHVQDHGYAWGMINNVATQIRCQEQGMRFFPVGGQPQPGIEIVGYTHGMIRCIYETVRMGEGTAFEMSIGTDTFKLASCLSCSSFMMANGVDASSSHLGAGESWVPYYSAESHNASHYQGKMPIEKALVQCNNNYATCMHDWMTVGAAAMAAAEKTNWVEVNHKDSLAKLLERLKTSQKSNTVARDLYLDAMTYHKKDVLRLTGSLVYGTDKKAPYDGTFDWRENQPIEKVAPGISLNGWVNPFTDEEVKSWHVPPTALVNEEYKITVWSPQKDDSCALDYSLLNAKGKEVQKGILAQGPNQMRGIMEVSVGNAAFIVPATDDVAKWKIKFAGDKDYSLVKLDQQIAIGSGDRYSHTIINTGI